MNTVTIFKANENNIESEPISADVTAKLTAQIPILQIRDKRDGSKTFVPPSFDFEKKIQKLLLHQNPPLLLKDRYENEYLGILCLRDKAAICRKYHMFFCKERNMDESYAHVKSLYKNAANIEIANQVTTQAISALWLFHCVRKHFSEHEWNAKKNVFSTEMQYNERELGRTINEIKAKEFHNLNNFLKFLTKY